MRYLTQTESAKLSTVLRPDGDLPDRSYSNGDVIQGELWLDAHEDMIVEAMTIAFIGRSVVSTTARSPWARRPSCKRTLHTFLMMQQPIDRQNHLIRARANEKTTYRAPFAFTVPSLLLPHACKHASEPEISLSPASPSHLHLPPSFETSNLSHSYDSPTTGQAKVEYLVVGRCRVRLVCGGIVQRIATHISVHIEPRFGREFFPAGPSMSLHREAYLAWRVFSGSQHNGQLSLRTNLSSSMLSIPTMIGNAFLLEVDTGLEFTPELSTGYPPQLHSVEVSLRSFTNSSMTRLAGQSTLPSYDDSSDDCEVPTDILKLGCYRPSEIEWQMPRCAEPIYEDQRFFSGAEDGYSDAGQQLVSRNTPCPRYSASLKIPVTLTESLKQRGDFQFIPTFNSCIVNRNYSLELRYLFMRPSRSPILSQGASANVCVRGEAPNSSEDLGIRHHQPKWRQFSRKQDIKVNVPVQVIADSSIPLNLTGSQLEGGEDNESTQHSEPTVLGACLRQSTCLSCSSIGASKYKDRTSLKADDLPSYRAIVDQPL